MKGAKFTSIPNEGFGEQKFSTAEEESSLPRYEAEKIENTGRIEKPVREYNTPSPPPAPNYNRLSSAAAPRRRNTDSEVRAGEIPAEERYLRTDESPVSMSGSREALKTPEDSGAGRLSSAATSRRAENVNNERIKPVDNEIDNRLLSVDTPRNEREYYNEAERDGNRLSSAALPRRGADEERRSTGRSNERYSERIDSTDNRLSSSAIPRSGRGRSVPIEADDNRLSSVALPRRGVNEGQRSGEGNIVADNRFSTTAVPRRMRKEVQDIQDTSADRLSSSSTKKRRFE